MQRTGRGAPRTAHCKGKITKERISSVLKKNDKNPRVKEKGCQPREFELTARSIDCRLEGANGNVDRQLQRQCRLAPERSDMVLRQLRVEETSVNSQDIPASRRRRTISLAVRHRSNSSSGSD